MGSIYSKVSSTSSISTRDSTGTRFQHGSSTGVRDPPEGNWILVNHKKQGPPTQKVSVAKESASNASGHKGHITNSNMRNMKQALETLNNIFLLLSEEEPNQNEEEGPCTPSKDRSKSSDTYSTLYTYKINKKGCQEANNLDLATKVPRKVKAKGSQIKPKSFHNHKGNKYSTKPYPAPKPRSKLSFVSQKQLRKERKAKDNREATKAQKWMQTKIYKLKKSKWVKENKGYRYPTWSAHQMEVKQRNLKYLQEMECLLQQLHQLKHSMMVNNNNTTKLASPLKRHKNYQKKTPICHQIPQSTLITTTMSNFNTSNTKIHHNLNHSNLLSIRLWTGRRCTPGTTRLNRHFAYSTNTTTTSITCALQAPT